MISGPKVDLYVGEEKKHYNLPKPLLCHYSDYFDACFNGNFSEAQSQKLELPDDKVQEFEILLEYMLRGTTQSIEFKEVSTGELSSFTIFQYICNNLHRVVADSLVTRRQAVRPFNAALIL
jgi:hypothetical protein